MNLRHKNCFIKFILLILLFLALACRIHCYAENRANLEYDIKAAFIYKFLDFIEWPDEHNNNSVFDFCIFGYDPFIDSQEHIANRDDIEKKMNPKLLGSFNNKEEYDFDFCNILFISSTEKKNVTEILKRIEGHNILTIGDTRGYAKKGVMINFYHDKNKIRFEINIDALKRSQIKISSKLLQLARIVKK